MVHHDWLADFMTARQDVKWIEQLDANGLTRFGITHPSSLKEMVWLLPKSRFVTLPVSPHGSITVTDHGPNSAMRAGNTRQASFSAQVLARRH